MSDLPAPETDDPRERDHGELFRASPRHLEPPPPKPGSRKKLFTMLTVAAGVVAAIVTLTR